MKYVNMNAEVTLTGKNENIYNISTVNINGNIIHAGMYLRKEDIFFLSFVGMLIKLYFNYY